MCLAVPGKLLSISGEDEFTRAGRIDFDGVVKQVSLIYVPEAKPGDYVLVHVGFALAVIDEVEARRVFELLQQLEEPAGAEQAAT